MKCVYYKRKISNQLSSLHFKKLEKRDPLEPKNPKEVQKIRTEIKEIKDIKIYTKSMKLKAEFLERSIQ